jgi:hypothetical protein
MGGDQILLYFYKCHRKALQNKTIKMKQVYVRADSQSNLPREGRNLPCYSVVQTFYHIYHILSHFITFYHILSHFCCQSSQQHDYTPVACGPKGLPQVGRAEHCQIGVDIVVGFSLWLPPWLRFSFPMVLLCFLYGSQSLFNRNACKINL